MLQYSRRRELGETYLRKVKSYSEVAGDYIKHHVSSDLGAVITYLRGIILANHTTLFSVNQAVNWIDNMTIYINALDLVKTELADHITQVSYLCFFFFSLFTFINYTVNLELYLLTR